MKVRKSIVTLRPAQSPFGRISLTRQSGHRVPTSGPSVPVSNLRNSPIVRISRPNRNGQGGPLGRGQEIRVSPAFSSTGRSSGNGTRRRIIRRMTTARSVKSATATLTGRSRGRSRSFAARKVDRPSSFTRRCSAQRRADRWASSPSGSADALRKVRNAAPATLYCAVQRTTSVPRG